MHSSLKTVLEGPPQTTPRRGRSLSVLPGVPRATALTVKGDQDHEVLLEVIGMLFLPQRETTRTVEWTDDWKVTEEKMWEATRKMTSQRGAGSGRDPGPDLGGSDGGHSSQTSAPLHEMSEGGNLTLGVADGEAGLAA